MAKDSMTDPMLVAAREVLDDALAAMKVAMDGAPAEALDWQPAGDETNSLAVLGTHAMHSTRSWLCVATGAPLPPRDRPSEFRATAEDAAALRASIEAIAADCRALLASPVSTGWAAMRRTHARPDSNAPIEVTGAWALLHALEHLREHVGQMLLTRQLWDAQAG
jgi:uncharacterized damage-inducible protein DinB